MTLRLRFLAAGVAAVAAATAGAADWTRLGLDFWNAPGLRRQVRDNLRRQAELDGGIAQVIENNRVRELVLRDLRAGRISVGEAAEWFHELGKDQPGFWAVHIKTLREKYPDLTDDERLCRHVIEQARRLDETGSEPGGGHAHASTEPARPRG
jgi:hypothetical protein